MRLKLGSIYRRLPAKQPQNLLRRQRYVAPSAPFVEIAPSPGNHWVVVYKIETFDGNGDATTVWLSTRTMQTSGSDVPADTLFDGVIAKGAAGSYRLQAFSGQGREAGAVSTSTGNLTVVNVDGVFDDWLQYLTDGSRVTCYLGKHGDPFPAAWRKVFITYVDGFPEFDRERMVLQFRNRDRLFDKDVVTLRFTDDSGSFATIDLERTGIPGGRKQKLVIGTPPPWEPILTNDLENIWQIDGPGGSLTDVPALYDGGVALINGGGTFGTDAPGFFQTLAKADGGGTFAHLTSEVRFGLRAESTGLRASPTISPARPWTVCDLAELAGISVDPTSMPAGSTNFSAGNRVAEDDSIRSVLADVARFEVAAIGLDRLDRFFARRIEPSFAGTSVHTFTSSGSMNAGDSDGLRFAKLRGAEKRVHTVKVRAGKTEGSPLTDPSFVDDSAVYDRLSRKPWMVEFTATCEYNTGTPFFRRVLITDVDPTAETAEVEIESHEFVDVPTMEAWALRFLQLHGARTVACSIETDLDFDTLQLNLLDTVTLASTGRFLGNRQAIIVSIEADMSRRKIRFGLWSHDENGTVTGTAAPTATEITITQENTTEGAGAAGAGSGVAGRGDAAPQTVHDYVNLADKTSALVTGQSDQDFVVPYDMTLVSVYGALSTLASSNTVIDIKANGVSIMLNKITIESSERSSLTASTQPAISAPSLVRGDRLTFHIDTAGTGGKGPAVGLLHYPR